AKPSLRERALVPHYLFDYVSSPHEVTAAQYVRDFYSCVEALPENIPLFVVGGTGFYFLALERGMYPVTPVAEEVKEEIKEILRAPGGPERLYEELCTKDPAYAQKIHSADHYRLGRALELIRTQGRSVTEIQEEFAAASADFPFSVLKVGPQWVKEDLAQRIQLRTRKMMEAGLVAEVRALLDQGLESWAPLQSVGYRETVLALKGEIPMTELEALIAQGTRQLAKKQKTWFQRDKEIHWCAGGDEGFPQARALVEKFLTS
ncbi:MAG: tRNA (adenosine(37)-N6)-dimethylallyltransferase MiaA, partial [Bdellovibrio sp.]